MKRFIHIFLSITILFTMFGASSSYSQAAKEWPKSSRAGKVSAASAIVMDINTGAILYKKKIDEKHYPASITKIMTTLLCIENSSLTDTVTFSHHAVTSIEPGSSHLWVVADEQIKMEDCLYGIMLMSANEICNGVAEHVAGSIEAFVDMMNEKAKSLGCTGTHFANPNGLYLDNHYTTAHDMALIAAAAMKNPEFRKITGTRTYSIPKTNKNDQRDLYNKHNMLHPINYPYGYDACIGGKTGYTDIARYTLVTFAKKGDMELVSVIMKANNSPKVEPNEYTDTTKILNFAFDNYTYHPMQNKIENKDDEKGYSLFSEYSPLFDDENTPIYVSENAGVVLPKGVDISEAERTIKMYDNVNLEDGRNVIGNITYIYDGKTAGCADIIYDTTKLTNNSLNEDIAKLYLNKNGSDMENKTNPVITNEPESEDETKQDNNDKEKETDTKNKTNPLIIAAALVLFIVILVIIILLIRRARLRRRYLKYYRGRRRRGRKYYR